MNLRVVDEHRAASLEASDALGLVRCTHLVGSLDWPELACHLDFLGVIGHCWQACSML